MNYLIKLKDGEEEHLVDTFMQTNEDGIFVFFYLEDLAATISFPIVNILSIKEFENTTFNKPTTKYV